MSEDWIRRAKAALAGVEPPDDTETLTRHRPPLFDPEGMRAVLGPILALFVWMATAVRETLADTPLDPIGLLLRVLALALTVRAVMLVVGYARRVRVALSLRRYGLALAPEGMLYRTPEGDRAIPRDEVIDIREQGDWPRRRGTRRWTEVYVVLRPGAPQGPYVALPPVFERTPGVLAERLMRWRGPVPQPEEPSYAEPHRVASKLYDAAAAGRPPPGVFVVRHGRAWLKRGPYATLLLGAALLEGFMRLPPRVWAAIPPVYPIGLAACLAIVPLVWIALTRRHMRPRKGIALLFTPAEVLMRTREGILRAQWRSLARVHIEGKPTWSVVQGYHVARRLVIERQGTVSIRYDEAFLGLPAEVVQGLCEAYKKGVLPGPAAGDEHPEAEDGGCSRTRSESEA